MAEENKTFYVGVNDPGELRKELLECSKEIITVLRTYDNISSVRKEKIERIIELGQVFGELKKLNFILKDKLPSNKIRAMPQKVKRVIKTKIAKTKALEKIPIKAVSKQTPEIRELENELMEIEERLGKISV